MNTEIDVKQRTPDWFSIKQPIIVSGSTIGTILGHNKYQTTKQLIRQIKRQLAGAPSEFITNDDVERGVSREPITTARVESELGKLFRDAGVFVHQIYPWIGVSPDPIAIDESCGLEIKNPRKIQPLSSKPNYEDQIRLCQEITGIHEYYYVSDAGDDEPLHIEKVDYDPSWFESVLPALLEFKEMIDAEPLEPHLEPLVKHMEGEDWEGAVRDYRDAKNALDAAKTLEAKARKSLIKIAGEVSAEGCGLKLTRIERAGSIDYSKVPQLENVDLEQYRKKGSVSYRIS